MLKRLEIQCVFKELVKDIVVKGQQLYNRVNQIFVVGNIP